MKFAVMFTLLVILPVAIALGVFYLSRPIKVRLERRRQRKTCPSCRDGQAVILVNDPESLCTHHYLRLVRINSIEQKELS